MNKLPMMVLRPLEYKTTLLLKYFILLISINISGCSVQQNEPDIYFDLVSIRNKSSNTTLSNFANHIKYVQLEQTSDPNSILDVKTNTYINMDNYHIVAHNSSSLIRIYDTDGHYINSIGSMGNGPGEYSRIDQLTLKPNGDGIWILDCYKHLILDIGLDGIVWNSIKVPKSCVRFTVNSEGFLYLLNQERNPDKLHDSNISVINTKGMQIDQIPLYKNKALGAGATSARIQNFYYLHGELQHSEPPFESLYALDNNSTWRVTYILDLGPKKIVAEDMQNPRNLQLYVDNSPYFINLLDLPNQIFATFRNEDLYTSVVIDKEINKLYVASRHSNKNRDRNWFSGLENDIDEGIPFWPMGKINENSMYRHIDPLQFYEYLNSIDCSRIKKNGSSNLHEFVKTIDIYGNPIIIITSKL